MWAVGVDPSWVGRGAELGGGRAVDCVEVSTMEGGEKQLSLY